MSLTGQTAWVVGGVGVIGRGIARGLLKAGATVVVNSRSEERLERIQSDLEHPERLIAIHGSLLPDQGVAETVERALKAVIGAGGGNDGHGRFLQHVVAHGAVRYWTTKRALCDETFSLVSAPEGESFLKLDAEDFRRQSSQLATLHFSAARNLIPRVRSSYTFVTGDGGGHPSTLRSAMGEINSHHVWGLSAALREEALSSSSYLSNVLVRELRVGLPVNRRPSEADPRMPPLSEAIGDLCAGMAAAGEEIDQGRLFRIETQKLLDVWLIKYHAYADQKIGPLPSFAEFVGSL